MHRVRTHCHSIVRSLADPLPYLRICLPIDRGSYSEILGLLHLPSNSAETNIEFPGFSRDLHYLRLDHVDHHSGSA